MKTIRIVLVTFALMSGGLTSPSWATDRQSECYTSSQQVTGVATATRHVAAVNFITTGGQFHAIPLISATVEVTEPGSCLVVHFQPQAHPSTAYLVYQIRVNGVPMPGQRIRNLYVLGAPPAFEQPGDDPGGGEVWPLASYTFLQIVNPGMHHIEVLYAVACLGGQPRCQRAIDSATLIVGYK